MKLLYLAVPLLVMAGCESNVATADGTQLFFKTFAKPSGPIKKKSTSIATDATENAPKLRFDIESSLVDGSERITRVTVVAEKSNGWTLGFGGVGTPTNLGTLEAPMMGVPILVHQSRAQGCSTHSRTTSFQVVADGTVKPN